MRHNIILPLSSKQLEVHKLICPVSAKHGLFTEDAILTFEACEIGSDC